MSRPGAASLALLLSLVVSPARALARPAFEVGIGMGASQDRTPPDPPPHTLMTSFFFAAGLWADRLAGLDVDLYANAAPTARINRIAGEITGALRPCVPVGAGDDRYALRVLRSLTLEAGPALERVSARAIAHRLGIVVGAHVDLPLGPPQVKELRLRLGVRRLLADQVAVGDGSVGDAFGDAYAMLAVLF